VGQHVSLTASSLPGLTVTGDVCFVSMSGRPDSNAFDVEIKVETPDSRLKPGMIVEVSVLRRVWDNSILIPLNAAVPQRGEHLAYVVENRKAVARVLRIEQIYGKEAVIASGLKEGEQLVVEGQRTLQDGMPVEVADVSGGADRGSL
jgi:membrane fusion protein (multidrug efflux system)